MLSEKQEGEGMRSSSGAGDGWRKRKWRRRDGAKEEKREAHFYQSEIFDSAERVTLERKTKAGRLSLSFSPFVFLITPLLHPPPPFIKDISAIFTYNRKITLAHLLNSSFCS